MHDDSIWTRFWQFDRVASCLDGDDHHNYAPEIADGWKRFFGSLPRGARVLDLCTGNGAIALLAVENGNALNVTGIDRAAIDPARHATRFAEQLASITFHGGVAAESLPFAEASMDAVVSQYGIEYTIVDQSIAQVARVLAPGGRMRCILHAAEGIVYKGARAVLADADFLLQEIQLPARASRAFDTVRQVETMPNPSPDAVEAARAAFAAFAAALERAAAYYPQARDQLMIANTANVLREAYQHRHSRRPDELRSKAAELEAEIIAHRGRCAALIDAARSASQMREISERTLAAGLADADFEPVTNASGLIGHLVTARKPD